MFTSWSGRTCILGCKFYKGYVGYICKALNLLLRCNRNNASTREVNGRGRVGVSSSRKRKESSNTFINFYAARCWSMLAQFWLLFNSTRAEQSGGRYFLSVECFCLTNINIAAWRRGGDAPSALANPPAYRCLDCGLSIQHSLQGSCGI